MYASLTEGEAKPHRNSKAVRYLVSLAAVTAVGCALVMAAFALANSNHNSTTTTTLMASDLPHEAGHLRYSIPEEYAVALPPAHKNQAHRGTCWIFATIAMLEHQYRLQGVRDGFLKPDEYVQFSEQAFGSTMMDLCQRDHQQCMLSGDRVAWGNTASGGETALLAYFGTDLGNRQVLPHAVCPYQTDDKDGTDPTNDRLCPGKEAALATNPVKFTINSWDTLYTVSSIKQALARRGRAMGVSTAMFMTEHFIPCIGATAKKNECAPTKEGTCQTYCPAGKRHYPTECCLRVESSMYNQDGEFYAQDGSMIIEGGHAMMLVGYSDSYTTRNGDRGGFIIRNSWDDGLGAGSHSIAYFKQEISEVNERVLCPNSFSPVQWYQCGREPCNSPYNVESAKAAHQPNELKCTNKDACDVSENVQYYTRNVTEYMDSGMHVTCFLKYTDGKKTAEGDWCSEPMLLKKLQSLIVPVTTYKDSDDHCGYYFMPYRLAEVIKSQFGGWYVNDFDVTFADESYVANAKPEDKQKYQLLRESTKTQETVKFDGPFPDKVVRLH